MSKDSKLCLGVEVNFRTIHRQVAMPAKAPLININEASGAVKGVSGANSNFG